MQHPSGIRYSDQGNYNSLTGTLRKNEKNLKPSSTLSTTIKSKPSLDFRKGDAIKTLRIADYFTKQAPTSISFASTNTLQKVGLPSLNNTQFQN